MACSALSPSENCEVRADMQGQRLNRDTTLTFQAIADKFNSIEDVQQALREQGLESSQLVFGIDFTKVQTQW